MTLSTPRSSRLAGVFLLATWPLMPGTLCAQPVLLEVVGQPTLRAHATETDDGATRIVGQLNNEAGEPLGGLLHVQSPETKLPIPTTPCAGPQDPHTAESSVIADVRIGSDGGFCFIVERERGEVELVAKVAHFLEEALVIRPGTPHTLPGLRFARAPQVVELGEESRQVVEVLLDQAFNVTELAAQIKLLLSCPEKLPVGLGSEKVSGQMMRFEFGMPVAVSSGHCEFLAQASAPGYEPATARRNVLLRSSVQLAVVSQSDDRTMAKFVIRAQSLGHDLHSGVVEVRHEGAHLVSAPVHQGRASVEIEKVDASKTVKVIFVPSGPAFSPAEPLTLQIAAKGPSRRLTPLHVGLLGLFFAWLTYIWLRPSMSAREVEKVPPKVGSIISQKNVSGRIFGQVLDAHTGEAIFNAQLELKRREATEAKTIETATTNREGRFQFNTKFKGSDHMTLTASTSTHMTIHALVHSAEVTVHLILRRRETLRQLIEWARTRGTPWHRSPASTPFQVRTAADGLKRSVEKGWSEDVARAAYGAKTPKEQEVRALRTPETWEESHHQRDHPGDD